MGDKYTKPEEIDTSSGYVDGMQAETKDEPEFEIPKCDKCGAPITTGLMAAFCPARKNCEFYVEGIEEFMSEFDASLSSGRSGSGDGGMG